MLAEPVVEYHDIAQGKYPRQFDTLALIVLGTVRKWIFKLGGARVPGEHTE